MTTGYEWARKRTTDALLAEVIAVHREEDHLHIAVIDLLRASALPGVVYWHTPNGGKRSKREAARFKAMGVLAGVADVSVSLPGRRFVFLELKSKRGVVSAEQQEFLDAMMYNGHFVAVARSLEDAARVLTEAGAIRKARVRGMTDWTPAEDARLTEMLAAGLSATQIGAALGRTRSAVIGRTHRLEDGGKTLIRIRGPVKPPGARKYTPRRVANRLPQPVATPQRKAASGILSPAEVRAAPVIVAPPPPPTGDAVGILEVTGCRFPVSDEAPHVFCNSSKRHEDTYCEFHRAIAYNAPREARRA